jgi:hypothetical protein
MPPRAHPCSPEGWPLAREAWLEDGYGSLDPSDEVGVRVTPAVAVVESIVKRYAEDLQLIGLPRERALQVTHPLASSTSSLRSSFSDRRSAPPTAASHATYKRVSEIRCSRQTCATETSPHNPGSTISSFC